MRGSQRKWKVKLAPGARSFGFAQDDRDERPAASEATNALRGGEKPFGLTFFHLAAIAIPGPASQRPANGAAAEIAARLHLPLAAAGRNSSGFSTAGGDGPKTLVPLGKIEGSLHPPQAAGALQTPCGARKTLRAYACPPCRIAIPGPAPRRPANGAAAEIAARLHLPLAAAGRNSSRFPTAAEIATRLYPPQAAAGRNS